MSAILQFLPAAWTIIKNIGLVIDFVRTVQKVVEGVSKRDQKLPNCEETKLLISSVRGLLDKGVIDLPGVDEAQISHIIGQIEDRVVCSIEKIERDTLKLKGEESPGVIS